MDWNKGMGALEYVVLILILVYLCVIFAEWYVKAFNIPV